MRWPSGKKNNGFNKELGVNGDAYDLISYKFLKYSNVVGSGGQVG